MQRDKCCENCNIIRATRLFACMDSRVQSGYTVDSLRYSWSNLCRSGVNCGHSTCSPHVTASRYMIMNWERDAGARLQMLNRMGCATQPCSTQHTMAQSIAEDTAAAISTDTGGQNDAGVVSSHSKPSKNDASACVLGADPLVAPGTTWSSLARSITAAAALLQA